jgi:hypothetical protein
LILSTTTTVTERIRGPSRRTSQKREHLVGRHVQSKIQLGLAELHVRVDKLRDDLKGENDVSQMRLLHDGVTIEVFANVSLFPSGPRDFNFHRFVRHQMEIIRVYLEARAETVPEVTLDS